tara:strand:- start:610 stop:993 length:384 start_codon:yes stop_codon:yes gene_type:complete
MGDIGVFQWREERYRLNRTTLAFWPRARMIMPPADGFALRLVTNDKQLLTIATETKIDVPDTTSPQEFAAACINLLREHSYRVWSVEEALAHIQEAPDSSVAAALVPCLEQWFFLEKFPPALPTSKT